MRKGRKGKERKGKERKGKEDNKEEKKKKQTGENLVPWKKTTAWLRCSLGFFPNT